MEDQLKDFIHFLIVEKGLAKNTIISYERDLKSYIKYFRNVEQLKSLNEVERIHIIHFLGYLKEQGKSSRTLARHIASIRAFHQFLLRDRVTDHDPSVHIETPKLERTLPKVLNLEEVETLLDAPNTKDHYGIRDKAMLELLYATGIRVSELIGLQVGDVHLTMGFVRCIGKGNKERIIPIGKTALAALEHYLNNGRHHFISKNNQDHALFLNHHGRTIN